MSPAGLNSGIKQLADYVTSSPDVPQISTVYVCDWAAHELMGLF